MLKAAAVRFAKKAGRFRDWNPGERRTLRAEPVVFRGDIPSMAGQEFNQYRLVLEHRPPLITEAAGVVYTARGMAWIDGVLERRFSFQEVGLRHILEGPGAPRRVYPAASILQSQTPCTYGDWVSEHLAALALAVTNAKIVEPLLLPGWWFAKPYVQRDLATLGIRAEPVDATVRIAQAQVVNKTRHGHYWIRDEVDAVVAAMHIERRPCEPGSALYLSRKGEKGEGPKRTINNDLTEAAMERAGVKVVRTVGLDRAAYIALAGNAETVFADHGSASYNMMYWQSRRFVELFAPDYWESAFLFLADCLGIHDYHLLKIDPQGTVEPLAARIEALRAEPLAPIG